MKHYFSFLVLSLLVFLSLVCPSPVMAELVSSLKVEAEDGLNIEVINGSNCSPSNMSLNTESKFGGYSGTGGMISPQSGGEVYLPLVINYNGASYGSMTVDFQIRCGNNQDDKTYINFYQECAGNESPDLRISSSGSYYNKYYKKVASQKVYAGGWYEAYQTHTVNRSFTEGSYLIGLYAKEWAIYDYVQIIASAAIIQDGDEEPSCTEPNHVDISGNWDYFGGETIELTAQAYSSAGTGDPIDENNITGYQWKHNGVELGGQTSKVLRIENCSPSDGGNYSCVVSTGATCSTESSLFGTKVYVLQCYTGGTTNYNFTRDGSNKIGSVEVPLAFNSQYEFKIYAGSTTSEDYYMGNNGTINEDILDWDFESGKNNVKVNSGLGGTFTFTINYTANGGAPKISVMYPRKTMYLNTGGSSLWNKDGAQFAIYYFRKEGDNVYGKGWTDIMSTSSCNADVFIAEIPQWSGMKINAVRLKETATNSNKSDWWNNHKHNQTNDCPISANDYITITGWTESSYTYTTYAPPTYTITFADNGSDGGSTMSDFTAIPCGESRTLLANTWEKSGYTFTGWKTNVAISTSAGDIAADGIVPNEATIQDITQNITLTAQWASAAGKTVPCSLGFYYKKVGTGTQDKVILDSDFSYSCNKDNAKNDQHNPYQEVCFSGAGHTLTSRMTVTFPSTGTYTFTFPLYIKESGNYDAPRVTVNGQQSDLATISTTGAENRNYETTLNVTAGTYTVSVWIGNTNEKVFFSTMDIALESASGELTISSLPWDGSQNLTEGTVVSAEAISSCFDTEITFTFTGEGTVNYYYNDDRETLLGPVQSGQPITLTNDLRARGIYIECTSGAATLTEVSKTTIGAVYEIWSVTGSKLGAVEVGDWSQQVVLGPEHFQTAIVGDVLRVYTSDEADGAQGALQYIRTEGDTHTYLGLDNATSEGLRDWTLSGDDKSRHYFEITIDATHLANLQHYGVIVKGRYYTIKSVELRASCDNHAMRTTAPDVTPYGKDGLTDIMAERLVFPDGFKLGNWEHKLELDKKCFNSVEEGCLINFYMSVGGDATISFRCNVDSIHAKSYDPKTPLCPSYGDISFDRTIDDLYGDEPQLIGQNRGYRVLYLKVDEDMLRRLKETGMILCGKGAFIKAVEAVPNPFVINPGDNKEVPTVVNNLEIHQGGEAKNNDDIEVLGSITYFRPAKGGHLNNKLDIWYTFTLPFTVNDVEVKDMGDQNWYDINAVYYSDDKTDQDANKPNGAGHYYLQYLSKQPLATNREEFINRWQYITPGHSLECVSEYENGGTRYGYPKKNEAYIILFDRVEPIGNYFETNTEIRFVGGPQTIEGIAKTWKVPSDGNQYWMYANNTLHSFTLDEAYILNEEGTYFILQSNPTIRPFECYVQATASLKAKYAALPMRGFNIEDNTPTGAESIQGSAIRAEKILRNGQLIIIRNGVEYDATGAVIR